MHCPPERLEDLAEVLEEVRRLPKVVESKPGIFYVRRTAFMHFHLTNGLRSADIRSGKQWGAPVDVPFGMDARAKAELLREVRRRHSATVSAAGR